MIPEKNWFLTFLYWTWRQWSIVYAMLEGILDFPHLLVSVHGADVLIGMSPTFEDPILLYERQTSYPTAIGHRFFMALAQ